MPDMRGNAQVGENQVRKELCECCDHLITLGMIIAILALGFSIGRYFFPKQEVIVEARPYVATSTPCHLDLATSFAIIKDNGYSCVRVGNE